MELRNPQCRACPLHKSTVNVCVMGRGNVDAPIHLIGEAPGEAESRTGLPFMGKAGVDVLNPILDELGIADKVYISNICRCRPPNNRTPTTDETNVCSQLYLMRELAIVQPIIVVGLGGTAKKFLFPSFTKPARGTVLKIDLFHTMVYGHWGMHTWHPAYCLPHRGGHFHYLKLKRDLERAANFVLS